MGLGVYWFRGLGVEGFMGLGFRIQRFGFPNSKSDP